MIRNIIFDFGGVLLDLDIQKSYDEMSKWLHQPLIYPELPDDIREIVWKFETGQTSTESFLWSIQNLCTKPLPQGLELVRAWNAMLLGWDARKFDLLLSLRKKYKVYLLSNTNELHIHWVRKDLLENHGISDFENRFFDKVYFSFEVGLHKPDPEIYRHVLEDSGLIPSETLFIDDALVNIHTAAKLGLHVYHHNPNKDLVEIFTKHGWL